MKKWFLRTLLCAALCLTPAAALAADDITATGLDLSVHTPMIETTYQAGSGAVVWTPVLGGGNVLTGGTLTLTNAEIRASTTGNSIFAFSLPGVPVTVVCNGTNHIAAESLSAAYAFHCTAPVAFELAAGSGTNLTATSQNAYGILADGTPTANDVSITGSGALSIAGGGGFLFAPIFALDKTVRFSGGTLALSEVGGMGGASNVFDSVVTLGGATIPPGKTLDLQLAASVVKGNSGAVNNGTLILPAGTTVEQIVALGIAGSGVVKAGGNSYTNSGMRIHTQPLLFTEPAAVGNWNPNATLDADGYTFQGSAPTGYTLTLGHLIMDMNEPLPAIFLPGDGPVTVVLTDGTTARITNDGGGTGLSFSKQGAEYPCAITGDGKLEIITQGIGCLATSQPLTIAGGTITMTNRYPDSACLDTLGTALTISGGRLHMTAAGNGIAVKAASVTLGSSMAVLSPAGAVFLDGRFRLDGVPVARLIIGAVHAAAPKTGDGATPAVWTLLALIGLLGLGAAACAGKRKSA